MQSKILITIDVEDWFQVENFRPWIPFDTWDRRDLRVERNVHQLLNLFDSIELTAHSSQLTVKNQKESDYELSTMNYELAPKVHNELSAMSYQLNNNGPQTTDHGRTKKVQATFFVLGWLAERLPHLAREIHSRGHEVASHGNEHDLCDRQTKTELKKDLTDSKKKLEDIIGSPVAGYRAPNFSINNDILKLIENCGYSYDSSYNSFALHGRYGKISLNGHIKKGIAYQISDNFFELPISNLALKGRTLPLGGGGYFRLIPFPMFKLGVKKILNKQKGYLFYLHPWEIDSDQPRVKEASINYRFRHYTNLGKTKAKLTRLIDAFHSCQFITCSEYLKSLRRG